MITDESSVFDVLGDFFYHADPRVRAAALEVYVRRAFISYEVTGLNNQLLSSTSDEVYPAVKFEFLLPQSHPNRSIHRHHHHQQTSSHRRSDSDVTSEVVNVVGTGLHQDHVICFRRQGVMAAFRDLEHFRANFSSLVDLFFGDDADSDIDEVVSVPNTPGTSYEESPFFRCVVSCLVVRTK